MLVSRLKYDLQRKTNHLLYPIYPPINAAMLEQVVKIMLLWVTLPNMVPAGHLGRKALASGGISTDIRYLPRRNGHRLFEKSKGSET